MPKLESWAPWNAQVNHVIACGWYALADANRGDVGHCSAAFTLLFDLAVSRCRTVVFSWFHASENSTLALEGINTWTKEWQMQDLPWEHLHLDYSFYSHSKTFRHFRFEFHTSYCTLPDCWACANLLRYLISLHWSLTQFTPAGATSRGAFFEPQCTLDSRHSSKDTRVYQRAQNSNGNTAQDSSCQASQIFSRYGRHAHQRGRARFYHWGCCLCAGHLAEASLPSAGVESAIESVVGARPTVGVEQVAPRWASRMWLEASLQAWRSSELCLKRQEITFEDAQI